VAADLFDLGELVSYLQVGEFDTLTAQLARDLVTAEIRIYAGPAVYDALSDVDRVAFKAVALAAAKRVVLNPSGLRSMQIDDYSETFATETFGDAELTAAEKDRIDLVLGRSGGAFTIRPAGTPDCPPPYAYRGPVFT
jgi:hypothetical protein